MNIFNKRDTTLLSIGFAVVIVQSPFVHSKMDPFVGYMNGGNIPNVIVRDVVPVLELCIGQDVCQYIFIEVHISNIIESSSGVRMGCSPIRIDVDGFVCGLDVC